MIDAADTLPLAKAAMAAGLAAGRSVAGAGAEHGDVQAEALLVAQRTALTRFSDFQIHQNVADDEVWLSLRLVIGGRTGVAMTNSLGEPAFDELSARAARFAMSSPADPDFVSIPGPEEASAEPPGLWVSATAESTPAARSAIISGIFERCREVGVAPAGALSADEAFFTVVNSLGVERSVRVTEAEASLVCTAPSGETGWAESFDHDVDALDPDTLAARAAGKALAARDAIALEPGPWTVVLEPAAVAELVGLLSYCGFGALAEQEGQSFLSGRLGEKVAGQALTIVDDGTDPRTMALPFDFEGVPKRRVMLIDRGRAVGVVHDSYTANRAETHSTGHALPAPNSYGPLATSLVMSPGDSSLDKLIAGTDRGVLVTRFFYTNVLDPRQTLVTGMTRDGLYRIEGGKVAGAAKNMRITQSVLEAFSNISALSADLEAHRSIIGTVVAPAARIEGFAFSSGTEF